MRITIIGAGPVGLSLALGLARQGIQTLLIEQKPRTSQRSKAPGIHLRTREIFRQWGIEDRFLAAGVLRTEITLHAPSGGTLGSVDFSVLTHEADRPGLLILEQARTEALLLEALHETGLCELRFGTEAVALMQDEGGVHLRCLHEGVAQEIETDYVIGCDGAGSFTRNALGLPFDGFTYRVRPTLADIRIVDARDDLPWPLVWNGRGGLTAAIRLEPGLWRLIRLERGSPDADETVPEEEIGQYLHQTLGAGAFTIEWANRFRIHLRAAPRFRVGRVLLAGDAAHVHSPAGGMGMNAGIQDAHNLAWKLAAIADGDDADRLLESYDIERRAVTVGKVSARAHAITRIFLQSPPALRAPAFGVLRLLLAIRPVRYAMLRRLSMIALRYENSPLLKSVPHAGRRLPNPLLHTEDGQSARLHDILPDGAFLIHLSARPEAAPLTAIRIGSGAWHEKAGLLRRMTGGREGWILVRPDLHIGWTGTDRAALRTAIPRALGMRPG